MNLYHLLANSAQRPKTHKASQDDVEKLLRGFAAFRSASWFNRFIALVGILLAYQNNLIQEIGYWGAAYALYLCTTIVCDRVIRRRTQEEIQQNIYVWQNCFVAELCGRALMMSSYAFIFLPKFSAPEAAVISFAVIFVAFATSHIEAMWSYTVGIRGLRLFLILLIVPTTLAWMISPLTGHFLFSLVTLFVLWVCELLGRANIEKAEYRERVEHQLAGAAAQLEIANTAKTRLLVEASHDLRQPVHALEMLVSLLRTETQKTPFAQRVSNIQSSVNTLSDMLTDLLDMSRLDDGKYSPKLEPTQLFPLMLDIESSYVGLAQRKGLALVVKPSNVWIQTDPVMLQRVLNNILVNAIKYTQKGRITVSCSAHEKMLWIHVRDTGIGMEKEKIDQIFSDYTRLDEARSEHGYGIGLAVVKRMIDVLGCTIRVVSDHGKGSVFSLGCPYAAQTFEETKPNSTQLNTDVSLAGTAICLIENDPLIRLTTEEMLITMGIAVVSGASAQEVLSSALKREISPDLVLADMHLDEGVNGLQAIEQLRDSFGLSELPAILITGDLDRGLQALAAQMRVDVVYKPVRSVTLRDMITHHVR